MASCDYLYATHYSCIKDFSLVSGSAYLYGYSPEDRSHVVDELQNKYNGSVTFVNLSYDQVAETISDTSEDRYNLRSSVSIQGLLKKYNVSTLYVDVSGLDNRVCAPLLKSACDWSSSNTIKDVRVVYAEPQFYAIHEFCAAGVFHDLAESIEGVSPLPQFASIIPVQDEDVCFVPLLGFEGGRFTHLLELVQPPQDNIYPVIGVPGFRAEYPFVAYWGNRRPLETSNAWRNVAYAAAHSLVDVFELLKKIRTSRPRCRIKIAPIGTKPHAIGAILFAIKYPHETELVYDNPKRQKKRTSGVGIIVETLVSKLLRER